MGPDPSTARIAWALFHPQANIVTSLAQELTRLCPATRPALTDGMLEKRSAVFRAGPLNFHRPPLLHRSAHRLRKGVAHPLACRFASHSASRSESQLNLLL
jgi:hypothetical protein